MQIWKKGALGAVAMFATVTAAHAGGFAVREQSTVFLGSAFAGAAAGGSLGSMYWNSAATAQFDGLNTESSYTLIMPDAEDTVTTINGVSPGFVFKGAPTNSGDIGIDAVASSSYAAYKLTNDLWVGLALNAPFGLGTKPDNFDYAGAPLGRTTKFFTINANPTLAYKIAPGVTVGAGVQIEWGRGKLQFGVPGGPTSQFKGDDFAFGATAGIMIEPAAGTSIGLGYRSQLTHELEGSYNGVDATGKVKLPDIVTLSLRQSITPDMRLLGTVEWTNWSRFDNLTLTTPGPTITIPAHWNDGWFFSAGGEYDYSSQITLRGGVAYEMTPVDDPTKRFTSIPDNNRIWLNAGLSYKWSEATTIDAAYSHIFIQDGGFQRTDPSGKLLMTGTSEASLNLFSVGMRTRW